MEEIKEKVRVTIKDGKPIGRLIYASEGKEDDVPGVFEYKIFKYSEEEGPLEPADIEPGVYDADLFEDVIFAAHVVNANDPIPETKTRAKFYKPRSAE